MPPCTAGAEHAPRRAPGSAGAAPPRARSGPGSRGSRPASRSRCPRPAAAPRRSRRRDSNTSRHMPMLPPGAYGQVVVGDRHVGHVGIAGPGVLLRRVHRDDVDEAGDDRVLVERGDHVLEPVGRHDVVAVADQQQLPACRPKPDVAGVRDAPHRRRVDDRERRAAAARQASTLARVASGAAVVGHHDLPRTRCTTGRRAPAAGRRSWRRRSRTGTMTLPSSGRRCRLRVQRTASCGRRPTTPASSRRTGRRSGRGRSRPRWLWRSAASA